MSWPLYLVGLLVTIGGLMVVESVDSRIAGLLVLAVVLSVALVHPTFQRELIAFSRQLANWSKGGRG